MNTRFSRPLKGPTFGEPRLLPWMACMPVLQEQKPVIDARRSAGDWHCPSSSALRLLPLPRLEGVTCIRYLLLGANTPWNRVRLTRGLGTNAASRARKSNGSKMTCMDALMPRAQDAQERPHGWCRLDRAFSIYEINGTRSMGSPIEKSE